MSELTDRSEERKRLLRIFMAASVGVSGLGFYWATGVVITIRAQKTRQVSLFENGIIAAAERTLDEVQEPTEGGEESEPDAQLTTAKPDSTSVARANAGFLDGMGLGVRGATSSALFLTGERTVRATVTTRSGAPLAGAWACALLSPGEFAPLPSAGPLACARADDHGVAELSGLSPAQYSFWLSATGHRATVIAALDSQGRPRTALDLRGYPDGVELAGVLSEDTTTLTVQTVDTGAERTVRAFAAGAYVEGRGVLTLPGHADRVDLWSIDQGHQVLRRENGTKSGADAASAKLAAKPPDGAEGTEGLRDAAGDALGERPWPAASVRGHVVSASGLGVQGARVEVRDGDAVYAVTSGEDGRFELTGLMPGPIALSAALGDIGRSHGRSTLVLGPGEAVVGAELRLREGATGRGRVQLEDGQACVAGEARVLDLTSRRVIAREGVVDGQVTLPALPAGVHVIAAQCFVPSAVAERPVPIVVPDDDTAEVDFGTLVAKGRTRVLRVLDGGGSIAPGRWVRVDLDPGASFAELSLASSAGFPEGGDETWMPKFAPVPGDGRVAIDGLPDAVAHVSVLEFGAVRPLFDAYVDLGVDVEQDVELDLGRRGVVSLVLRDAAQRPIIGALAALRDANGQRSVAGPSDAAGVLHVAGLSPGIVHVELSLDGAPLELEAVSALAPLPPALGVAGGSSLPEPAGATTGEVDEDASTARDDTGEVEDAEGEGEGSDATAEPAPDAALAPGGLTCQVARGATLEVVVTTRASLHPIEVDVRAPESLGSGQRWVALLGSAMTPDGQFRQVHAFGRLGERRIDVVDDAAATVWLGPAGGRLVAWGAGGLRAWTSVAPDASRVELALSASADLELEVSRSGRPLAGARVSIELRHGDAATAVLTTTTGAKGRARLQGVPAGAIRVAVIDARGHAEREVQLSPGEAKVVSIDL